MEVFMANYSKCAMSIKGSPIRVMMVKAEEMGDVISLSPGQPDFIPEPKVIETTQKMVSQSSRYAPGAGLDSLRNTYINYLNKEIGSDYKKENTMVTVGGMSAIHLTLCSVLDPGDEVLIYEPYFANYEGMVQMFHAVPVKIKAQSSTGFEITAEAIEKVLTPKTKLLLLNSPCNPTGRIVPKKELEKISKLAIMHDFFVLSDEVYRHILYDGVKFESIATLPGMKERTMVIDSCSKSSAMAGFRVGFLTGPEDFIKIATKTIENVYSCANTLAQMAAEVSLREGAAYREVMRKEYEKRRNYLYDRIEKIPEFSCKKPEGAFYFFINVEKTGLTGDEFANRLLEEKKVAIVPGSSFGTSGINYVRISYATSMENLKEAFDRIEDFVKSLH